MKINEGCEGQENVTATQREDMDKQNKQGEQLLTHDEIIRYIQKTSVVLSEKDFYPPPDKRYIRSGISDVSGGESFADYTKEFFSRYYDDMYDDYYF